MDLDNTLNDSGMNRSSMDEFSTPSRPTSWSENLEPIISDLRKRVEANPWLGVGCAAGACLAFGFILGRQLRSAPAPRVSNHFADYYGTNNMAPNNAGMTDRQASDNLTMSPSY